MPMDLFPIRIALYIALFVFAAVLLGLTAARLHYTLNLPFGDPLNGGVDFYDREVIVLLVASCLAILWSIFAVMALHRRYESRGRFILTFLFELVVLAALWLLYLGGSAAASNLWTGLGWCRMYEPCRILTALLAFAWIGWITLTVLILFTVLFAATNRAWREPMHTRYENRDSIFSSAGRRY